MANNNNTYAIKGFKTVEIMQEVERGFDGDFLNTFLDWSCVKDYAYIVHDKDDTRPHIHCMIRFNTSVPTSAIINRCAKIKEGVIEFQHLNKCYSWKSAIAYLTHANAQNKHTYDVADVVSNYDFEQDIKSALEKPQEILNDLDLKIQSGECRPFNITNYVSSQFYAKYKRSIDTLFEYYTKSNNLKKKGDRDMRLMYFYGGSGSGKTTFAKRLCELSGWSYYISDGGKNPLDNYGGEDCIILDDLRPSDYKFNEFLKLTDNNTSSMVHCRYYNKSLHYCRCIIVTSILKIDDFYSNLQEADNEQAKQVKRRFGEVYCFSDKTIDAYSYDNDLGKHKFTLSMDNPCSQYANEKRLEELKKKAVAVAELFGVKFASPDESKVAEQLELAGFTVIDMPDDLPF